MMKEKAQENWKIFNHLESLLDEWKSMGTWEEDQEETLTIIREKLGMDTFEKEEILKVEKLFLFLFDPANQAVNMGKQFRLLMTYFPVNRHINTKVKYNDCNKEQKVQKSFSGFDTSNLK
jgi:hypothetical protein